MVPSKIPPIIVLIKIGVLSFSKSFLKNLVQKINPQPTIVAREPKNTAHPKSKTVPIS